MEITRRAFTGGLTASLALNNITTKETISMTDNRMDPNYHEKPMRSVQPDGSVHLTRMGVLRLGSDNQYGAPYWHFNDAHVMAGFAFYDNFTPIVEYTGYHDKEIRVTFSGVDPSERVGCISLNSDESMAAEGVMAGGSGGKGYFDLSLYRSVISNGAIVRQFLSPRGEVFAGDRSNIWIVVHSWIPA